MVKQVLERMEEAAVVAESYREGASEEQLREASWRLANSFIKLMQHEQFDATYRKPSGDQGWISYKPTQADALCFRSTDRGVVYIGKRSRGQMEASAEERLDFIHDASDILDRLVRYR